MRPPTDRFAKKSRRQRDFARKDALSKKERSLLMGRIRGKNTHFERVVFKELRKRGVYFITHLADLPGKPDIVNREKKAAIFLDSDFWHGWRLSTWESNLSKSWRVKIRQNRLRDRRTVRKLRNRGWKVLRIWEHQMARNYFQQIDRIERFLG